MLLITRKIISALLIIVLTVSCLSSKVKPSKVSKNQNVSIDKYEIPFKILNGWIVMEVDINSTRKIDCIFDTGAPGESIRIDSIVAAKLNLKGTDTIMMGNPANNQTLLVPVTNIPSLHFPGGFQLKSINAMIRNLSFPNVQGVIGLMAFKDYLMTINYATKKIKLEKGELPQANDKNILSYTSMRGIPGVEISIGGKQYNAHFDTGNSRSKISTSKNIADKFTKLTEPVEKGRASTLGQTFTILSIKIAETLQVGKYTFVQPEINYPLPAQIVNFGNQFLSQFNITFDQKNLRVKLDERGK